MVTKSAVKQKTSPASLSVADALNQSFVGQYVLIRASIAGVFCGTALAVSEKVIVLANAHRLWKWQAIKGVALSSVAAFGVSNEAKIDAPIAVHAVQDWNEILISGDALRLSVAKECKWVA